MVNTAAVMRTSEARQGGAIHHTINNNTAAVMRTSEARQGGAIHHTINNNTAALAGPSPKSTTDCWSTNRNNNNTPEQQATGYPSSCSMHTTTSNLLRRPLGRSSVGCL
eukprot:CAMPEP_0172328176 /NCGR_PEP_ID=MMETSP1058-20130122/60216_1 /TAXON_ID=83371 /ORGANISM="Detonula confervacea, Strain CCMP 353" /LENGTH=108 /DNA_ID=CAMNT_0013045279 /DNA_START=874 /DNA_END=1200 /DNA_ORIENTATION=+